MNINKTKRKEPAKALAFALAKVRAIYCLTSFSAGTIIIDKNHYASTVHWVQLLPTKYYSSTVCCPHITTLFGDISKAELLKVPLT